jgi:hypothetical protein
VRQTLQLTPTRPTGSILISRVEAKALFVANPTASPIAIRATGPDIPAISNADFLCPANSFLTIPVIGNQFGFSMISPSNVVASSLANLATTVTIIALTADEDIPTFGAAQFQNTSQAILTGTWAGFAGISTFGPFDLQAWSGALVSVTNTAGITFRITISASDQAGTFVIGSIDLLPNATIVIEVPKITRNILVAFSQVALPGFGGLFTVTGTVGQITRFDASPDSARADLATTAVGSVIAATAVFSNMSAGFNAIHPGRALYLARILHTQSLTSNVQYALGNNAGPLVTIDNETTLAYTPSVAEYSAKDSPGYLIDVTLYNTMWVYANPAATVTTTLVLQ